MAGEEEIPTPESNEPGKNFLQISKELHRAKNRNIAANATYLRAIYGPSSPPPEALEKLLSNSLSALESFTKLVSEYNAAINNAAVDLGFPPHPPEEHIRIFRGVERAWNERSNLPNAFWSPDPAVASGFGKDGDVLVCDVPKSATHLIPGGDLGDMELQVPNPATTANAKVVIRNHQLVLSETHPPRHSVKQLLYRVTNAAPPKQYEIIPRGR